MIRVFPRMDRAVRDAPALNPVLDHQAQSVLDHPRFDLIHEAYIKVTGVQRAAGLVHLWFVLPVWSEYSQPSSSAKYRG